jgi:hypothetical protein
MNRRFELRGSASPEEAAAVIAAIDQFRSDTAPPSVEEGPQVVSPWVQTARLEGVDRDPGRGSWT